MDSLCIATPFGHVQIYATADFIVAADFVPAKKVSVMTKNKILLNARQQLRAYCEQPQAFDLPLQLQGTAFQQRVWQALQKIPAGEVRTYGDLAQQLNTSPRAIGGACRANPLPIIVPCHRVVSRHGLGGYSGDTAGTNMDIKIGLLRHEGLEIPA
ncbi:MAG: methylated-DNA-[protein]-cysteine S-methyltransferase [Pseudomonadota bacterium]|nr:methylated-DNA-[protein]-cysteine S-methyltransferase [Pseudomonadota bacterium]